MLEITFKTYHWTKNVQWTFLKGPIKSRNASFRHSFALFHFSTINGAAFSKPRIYCFSLGVKTLQIQTPVIKRKMDILEIEECPF